MQVGTHDGYFHADELLALATLRLCLGPLQVVRSRDPQLLQACQLRIDVGGQHDPRSGDFDHHQPGGAGERPDGIPYAAFGLVWQHYGAQACGGDRQVAERVDGGLVRYIDAHDNGRQLFHGPQDMAPMGVDRLLTQLNPAWDQADHGWHFQRALDLAQQILEWEIESARSELRAEAVVRRVLADSGDQALIQLPRAMPWQRVVIQEAPAARLVLFPRAQDWAVQAVPLHLGSFESRLLLPEDWAGHSDSELVRRSGVADARFCHSGRFFAVAGSRDGAQQLARLALNGSAG